VFEVLTDLIIDNRFCFVSFCLITVL